MQTHQYISKNRTLLTILFWFLVTLIIVSRFFLFFEININHIDSDQPFMWIGAKDYSKGIFHEPRFYGQDYNTFMEALLAVPLMWLSVPVYYALPLVTHVLFLFPFLFTAAYLFLKQKKLQALFVLLVLLSMTTAYDILNSLPRGFVTGLFFTSFFVISLLEPKNLKWAFFNFLMLCLGLFVNPNSVVVSLPFAFFIFLHNGYDKKFYQCIALTLTFGMLCHFFFDWFYINHPQYVIHGLKLVMSWNFFVENISHLDLIFGHISFFTEGNCLILLTILFILAFVIYSQNKKLFYSYLVFLALIFVSLFSSKTNDGSTWPYFSYSRVYLGVPLIICLCTSLLQLNGRIILLCSVLVILFTGYKFKNFKEQVACHTEYKRWLLLRLQSLDEIKNLNTIYKTKCKEYGTKTFIISNNFWLNTFINYGGPACYDDFPETQETQSERRYWVREKNNNKVIKDFMYLSSNYEFDNRAKGLEGFQVARIDNYGLCHIINNQLSTEEFIKISRTLELD